MRGHQSEYVDRAISFSEWFDCIPSSILNFYPKVAVDLIFEN